MYYIYLHYISDFFVFQNYDTTAKKLVQYFILFQQKHNYLFI